VKEIIIIYKQVKEILFTNNRYYYYNYGSCHHCLGKLPLQGVTPGDKVGGI